MWKLPRTTKIRSALYVSFWNDFHMWTSIFVHEIESKTRSRLTDSHLKNSLLLSVKYLTTNIEKLVKSKQTEKFH